MARQFLCRQANQRALGGPDRPCADLVVEGTSSGAGSPLWAGGRLSGYEGVAVLRYAPAQVSGPQAAIPEDPQAMSIMLGAWTNSMFLSRC